MSIYATIGENESAFFASTQGWRDVTEWADGLDEDQFEDVVHLVEHGYTDSAQRLSEQLQGAIVANAPSPDVSATLAELIDLLADESGEVIIDSGMDESQ